MSKYACACEAIVWHKQQAGVTWINASFGQEGTVGKEAGSTHTRRKGGGTVKHKQIRLRRVGKK